MQPLGHNVLVVRDNPGRDSKILTLSEVDLPNTGVVCGVGSKVSEVTEGDRVMFKDAFNTHKVPGEEDLIVMHEDNILLTL